MVELLTVLAIIGLLAVLSVSAVSSLRSTSLSTAGTEMVGVFAMARQHSISNDDYTAFVIQTTGTSACSAYCLLELPQKTDGTQDLSFASTWSQLTPWRFLPKGVVFENNPTSDTFMTTLPSTSLPPSAQTLPTLSFQGAPINLNNGMIVQCYQPDGTLIPVPNGPLAAGGSLQLKLIEGTADALGNTTNTSAGGADYYNLYFLANTGTTKIGRP